MYNIEDMESRNFRSPNSQQITIEGLQGVVAKSTIFPDVLIAFRTRHGFAKRHKKIAELSSYRINQRNF